MATMTGDSMRLLCIESSSPFVATEVACDEASVRRSGLAVYVLDIICGELEVIQVSCRAGWE